MGFSRSSWLFANQKMLGKSDSLELKGTAKAVPFVLPL